MKLSQISENRKLIKLTCSDDDIISKYGEPLDFYIWDKQPIEIGLALAYSKENEYDDLEDILKQLILNSKAEQVIQPGYKMPNEVLLAAFFKIAEVI